VAVEVLVVPAAAVVVVKLYPGQRQ